MSRSTESSVDGGGEAPLPVRSARWSPVNSVRELVAYRGFIVHLIGREIRTKYAGSLLGWLWALVNPLASLLVYSLVFGVFLRTETPVAEDGFDSFAHFLFSALVVWNLFGATSSGAMEAFRESLPLRRRVYFPPECPIIARAAIALIESGVEVVVLLGAYLLAGHVGATFPLLLVVLPLTAVLGIGVGLALSVLNARFRDISYLYSVVLRFLFFLTPIIYPLSILEGKEAFGGVSYEALIRLNPLTWFVSASRDVTYFIQIPGLRTTVAVVVMPFVALMLGWWVFSVRAPDIAEGQ